jgi:hypothetical protein
MYKLKEMILMLCFILSGALCYAHGEARMENEREKGILVEIKDSTGLSGLDKSNTITALINGHVLSVTFSENLGQVSVEVATVTGVSVQCLSVLTPNGLQVYIPNAGNYIVTFMLSNGDEYYGEFTVTD